jgi:hypothetical protein
MSSGFDISLGMKSSIKAASSGRYGTSMQTGDISFSVARVIYVLLDDSNKDKFNSLGGWKAIGTVECQPFINNDNPNASPIIAKPINPNITTYPVVNEVVMIIRTITYEAQTPIKNYKPAYYYTHIINGWNSVEHNAIPSDLFFKDGYQNVTSNFTDTGNVRNLIKAPGDMSIEGRSMNGIRIGSTVKGFTTKIKGSDRSPLLLITNNRAVTVNKATGSFEDINKDGSSIYMLNGHTTDFNYASVNFDSYGVHVDNTQQLNNNIVTIQTQQNIPDASNAQKDVAAIPKIDDTPKPQLPVNTVGNPTVQSNQSVDDSNLPDREFAGEQAFQETEDYIYDASDNEQTVSRPNIVTVNTRDSSGQITTVKIDKNIGASGYLFSPLAVFLSKKGYSNGYLPSSELRYLRTQDSTSNSMHRLHPIAAANWEKLYEEARRYGIIFNISYLVGAAYREIGRQKEGAGTAKKGFSAHGWGGAIDIQQLYTHQSDVYMRRRGLKEKPKYPCGSAEAAEVRQSSSIYKWVSENGPKYGWYNPYRLADNAGNQDEAWHFEYWGPV